MHSFKISDMNEKFGSRNALRFKRIIISNYTCLEIRKLVKNEINVYNFHKSQNKQCEKSSDFTIQIRDSKTSSLECSLDILFSISLLKLNSSSSGI